MPKPRLLLDWIALDASDTLPMYRQLYSQLRTGILSGRLTSGSLLPSSRTLARELKVSRNTVINAYDQLVAEGYLETSGGSSTAIANLDSTDTDVPGATVGINDDAGSPALSEHGLEVQRSLQEWLPLPEDVAFAPGIPAYDQFPAKKWSRLLAEQAQRMHPSMVDPEAHLGGYGPLREGLASYLRSSRIVACEPDQVFIVSSARAGLDLICRLVANAGDSGLVEEPGYNTAKFIMRSAGIVPSPVTVDAEGIDISSLGSQVRNAQLAFVTPSHQWPMGVSLSARRRQELLEWANRHNCWVVEDDYDSEFRFDSRPLATLQGLDGGQRVIYIGTFSKVLFPTLRTAYVVVPRSLISIFRQALYYAGQEPPLHIEAALAEFIREGHFFAHIRRMRRVYRRRQASFVDALTRHLGDRFPIARPPGGMQLALTLPEAFDAEAVCRSAAHAGLHVRSIGMYSMTGKAPNALHLGFAAVPDRRIQLETAKLASTICAVE